LTFTYLLREPLVHFLLIGIAIFALYELNSDEGADPSSSIINIDRRDIDELREQWLQQTGSEAEADTLQKLIDAQIEEEIMFREALRLGLDKNDTIVRRRLVQKMEFLSANLSSLDLPEETALLSYYENNSEKYRVDERRSFTHVYFSRDRRGDSLLSDAETLLRKLQKEKPQKKQAEWGDNFILHYDYRAMREEQLAKVFGFSFAGDLFALKMEGWQGPIVSEYGVHLILLHDIITAHLPSFADLRERVLDDYMQSELTILKKQRLKEMREGYIVNIDNS
jgi:peptidyl-prolyl cis-trans isomerase C